MAKQYGLIKPGNVFGDDDSDEETAGSNNAPKKVQLSGQHLLQKRQIEKMHEQAMEEDASVFLYDEVFDDIQQKRNESKKEKKSQEAKKPKYINKLLETAEKRKKEYERRIERQVQKEREAEGEMFKDKESFVTSAYRQKLEEIKEAELKEKREEYLESIGDVTKQGDLSGFYRHIYSQKMGSEDEKKQVEKEDVKKVTEATQKKKNYRKRESSNDEEPESSKPGEKATKAEHLNSNLDADSDFTVDSSSSEDESDTKNKKSKDNIDKKDVEVADKVIETQTPEKEPKVEPEELPQEEVKIIEPPKPKIDIWAKRTVGDAFVEAVKRYYERKALRESN